MSSVADPRMAVALGHLVAAIDEVQAIGVEAVDARDAVTVVREVARAGNRMRAVEIEALDSVDRTGQFKADGHVSAKAMVRYVGRLSGSEAFRRASCMRA